MPVKFYVDLCKKLLQDAPSPAFRSTLEDLLDAEALEMYMVHTTDFDEEAVLGAVVGLFYLTNLYDADQLPEDYDKVELCCVASFAARLLNQGLDTNEDDDVIEALEDAWQTHCASRDVQVDRTGPLRFPIHPPSKPELLFSAPFRVSKCFSADSGAGHKLSREECKLEDSVSAEDEELGGDYNSSIRAHQPDSAGLERQLKLESLPNRSLCVSGLFELLHRLMHTHHFMCLPFDSLGHNFSRYCKARNGCGWESVKQDFVHAAQSPVVVPDDPFVEPTDSSNPVSAAQLQRLLAALRSHGRGSLIRRLLTSRPPHSMLPHLYAVVDCTIHARLWLCGIDSKIYLDSMITYAHLGSEESARAEERACTAIFSRERVPSSLELRQRHEAYYRCCGFQGRGAEVLVLKPRDYVRLGAPENRMWMAVRKYFSHSIWYTQGQKAKPGDILHEMKRMYEKHLSVDRKWQKLMCDPAWDMSVPSESDRLVVFEK